MPIGTPEIVILVLVAFFIFGGRQLPKLARQIREARNELKGAPEDQAV